MHVDHVERDQQRQHELDDDQHDDDIDQIAEDLDQEGQENGNGFWSLGREI